MNILTAGGAGFIGSHLTDALLAEGHSVICADKLIMGDKNIEHLKDQERFTFVNIELSDQGKVDELFEAYHFDAVYHLAANSDIRKGGKEPGIDFRDTLLTTRAILEGMRKYKVSNIFFASTSAVYGEKTDELLTETTGGLRPVSYYGGCKLASEALISSYTAMNDFNTVICRFPNVIGPRLTHGVIYDFIRKLKADPAVLEILGDGTQCKPYIYVKDLAEAVITLTKQWEADRFSDSDSHLFSDGRKGGGGGSEELYNLSVEGGGITVARIAEIAASQMGLRDVKYRFTGGDRGWKGDVPRFSYDISRILSTGWKPRYTSEEAVKQSVRDALNGE